MWNWWCADLVSRVLAPEEREVVCGDIAESRATASRALRDVIGLAIRRHTMPWKNWRPWLALLGLVLPLSATLLSMSGGTATGTAVYSWL